MASSLVDIVEKFTVKTNALKQCMDLQNSAQSPACLADLKAINNEVTEIESLLQELRETNEIEQKKLNEGRALLTIVLNYQDGISHIANNLPSHLPGLKREEANQKKTLKKPAISSGKDHKPAKCSKPNSSNTNVNCPKLQYITVDDFEKVPKYIKGRISYSQVNNAIDEINGVFKEKYRILSLPKSKMGEHVMNKYKAFKDTETEETTGQFFVIDNDIKNYSSLKLDKAGRSILTILRHAGRLKEIRSGGLIRYVLNSS